ncbi:MAG: hypothetical protein QM731_25210 [Chitinophagaceae bacterium]
MKRNLSILASLLLAKSISLTAQPIDRKAVVQRHTINNTVIDSLNSLSVGNGRFAFTVDVTGLQSFPNAYAKGVSLGTQSEWAWNSFPNVNNYKPEESLKSYHLNGRDVTYMVQTKQPERSKGATEYFRQNVHRVQLGNLGMEILLKNGNLATLQDLQNVQQQLDMWTGEIHSKFTVEGTPVDVITVAHQQQDVIGVKIQSDLVKQQRLRISLLLPHPTGEWTDEGNNYKDQDKHKSSFVQQTRTDAVIKHELESYTYYIAFKWNGAATSKVAADKHHFLVVPAATNSFEFTCRFEEKVLPLVMPTFALTTANSKQGWEAFWKRGGAVDFAGSTDPRAMELERRMITSLYLTKIQCAGNYPPQETGLTYNSWFGKPHLEMHWWHGVHFALWGRTDLLEKSMKWYARVAGNAFAIAKRQGYEGLRWQKMTDHDGNESPSSVGAFLIWQQPHFIYFAELCYRDKKKEQTLQQYKDLVFATADFMASFAYYDSTKHRYILGKGVIPAQERFKAEETFNPTYELVYWHWALSIAQQWRERLHLPRNKKWDDVLKQLSPLPVQNNMYLATESATDSYTNPEYRTDHPSVFGALGMLPLTGQVDTAIMHNTFNWIWSNWTWDHTWGWDFPMTAMTATRLGLPAKAIDALFMPVHTNRYLISGHNYQDDRLRLYLPGNGGLLATIAMMCAGYDDNKSSLPGFPKDGSWKVKWEGLKPMP